MGDLYLNRISAKTLENRAMFVDCLHQNGLVAVNATFDKPKETIVTYKEKVPEHNSESEAYERFNTEPSSYIKYAKCDYLLTRKINVSSVKDIEPRLRHSETQIIFRSKQTSKSARVARRKTRKRGNSKGISSRKGCNRQITKPRSTRRSKKSEKAEKSQCRYKNGYTL